MTEYVQNPPPNADFAFDVWVTGSPVVTDSAPTTFASVSGNRITRLVSKNGSVLTSGQGVIRVVAVGGTSVTFVPFVWDATQSLWLPLAAATTVTSGGAPALLQGFPFFGAAFYCQITVVTSSVTAFGYQAG